MVSLPVLLQSVYDELKTVMNATTSVSNTDKHVGVLDRTKDVSYPFFGFEWQQNPVNRGTGGNQEVDGITTNASNNTDGVNIAEDYDLIIDIGILVEGDQPRAADQHFSDVQSHFNKFINSPTDLHGDVERVRDQGALPANLGQQQDVGIRKTYLIRYKTTRTESLPPAENVDWDVDLDLDAGDEDVYPEKY